jgi:hypothetical protein
MRMHNPPHPGQVLREYLGKTASIHGSRASAGHACHSIACVEWQSGNLRRHGPSSRIRPGHLAGTVDEHAIPV